MSDIVLAVDPGASGSLSISFGDHPDRICTWPLSTHSEGSLLEHVESCQNHVAIGNYSGLYIYIELVTGFIGGPNRGAHMFTFGRSYEYLFGICHALKIPLVKIPPATWQKHYDFPAKMEYKERKKWAVSVARERYPTCTRIVADTADSVLLCGYARSIRG